MDQIMDLGDLFNHFAPNESMGDGHINPILHHVEVPTPPDKCTFLNEPQVEFGIIMILLVVIGLIGNIFVFSIIVIFQEYKKSVSIWYILQLTFADTLFLLTLPFTARSEIVGFWEFSVGLCKFKEAVLFINCYASIYFLVIVSFDRYLAITKPFVSKGWMSSLRSPVASYIFSLLGWVLSVLLCIQLYQFSTLNECDVCGYDFPPTVHFFFCYANPNRVRTSEIVDAQEFNITSTSAIFGTFLFDVNADEEPTVANNLYGDRYEITNDQILQQYYSLNLNSRDDTNDLSGALSDKTCRFPYDSQTLKVWIYGNFIGAFCLPFLLICFFYGMIMSTVAAARKVGNAKRQRSNRRRVTMIVLALVMLFAVSWFPWYVEKLAKLNGIALTHSSCRTLENSVRVLGYFNSALNPYFYSFLGTQFRDKLNRASSRIGLSALRSRATQGSFMRRLKRSTSNSANSVKNNNKNGVAQPGERQLDTRRNNDPKFSVAQRTEPTLV